MAAPVDTKNVNRCMNEEARLPAEGIPKLVSVVVPCYNYAHFLAEAVLSVIGQTYTQWELIIVDDGSVDNTVEIAHRLQHHYSNCAIIVLHQSNGGLSAARNTGIHHAHGEYILTLDADDLLAPTFLEQTVQILASDPHVGIAYTDIRLFGTQEEVRRIAPFSLEDLKRNNRIVCHSLFRRIAWVQSGGFNTALRLGYEDWDFWLRVAEQGWGWKGVAEPLALYRKHGVSMHDVTFGKRLLINATIIVDHPQLYGPQLVQLAHEILDIMQPVAGSGSLEAETTRLKTSGKMSRTNAIASTIYEFIMGRVYQSLSRLPLYQMLWLRKHWFVLRQQLKQLRKYVDNVYRSVLA